MLGYRQDELHHLEIFSSIIQWGVDVSMQHTGEYLHNDHQKDTKHETKSGNHLCSLQLSQTITVGRILLPFVQFCFFLNQSWRISHMSKSLLFDSWALRSSVRRTSMVTGHDRALFYCFQAGFIWFGEVTGVSGQQHCIHMLSET